MNKGVYLNQCSSNNVDAVFKYSVSQNIIDFIKIVYFSDKL